MVKNETQNCPLLRQDASIPETVHFRRFPLGGGGLKSNVPVLLCYLNDIGTKITCAVQEICFSFPPPFKMALLPVEFHRTP